MKKENKGNRDESSQIKLPVFGERQITDRNKQCDEKDTLAVNDSKEEWDGDLMASNLMEFLEITEIPPPRLPMGR